MIPTLVSLGDYSLGEITRINFNELKLDVKDFTQINVVQFKSDLEILAEQPPVKVYPYYRNKDKEMDYEEGYRIINVSAEPGSPFRLSYVVKDSVVLEDSDNYSDCVGEKVYTQREIEKLRS